LHSLSSSFVLGYHGCDRAIAEGLLSGVPFNASQNDWDWLGHGIYFWEVNPQRGLEFARLLQKWRADHGITPPINDPYVIGAVIDLSFCLDLFTSTGTEAVSRAHQDFLQYCKAAGVPVPENTGGEDLVYRRLDCAVINHLHAVRKRAGLPEFDTVRGPFVEGGPIYPGSKFNSKTHIQICVRDSECIKGVFRVPEDQLET
jgi:hypothetical protein